MMVHSWVTDHCVDIAEKLVLPQNFCFHGLSQGRNPIMFLYVQLYL